MGRTTLTICLLFSWATIGFGADETENKETTAPTPEVQSKADEASEVVRRASDGKRIDTQVSPAVHVNSTGLENAYGSREKSAAVDRLRSVRKTPLLKIDGPERPSAKKVQAQAANKPGKKLPAAVGSSRRLKKAETLGDAPRSVLSSKPAFEVAALPESPKTNLPSVMKRRGLAEPTLALPKAAAPAKLSKSDFASPQLAIPATKAPVQPKPVPQSATPDFVAEISTLDGPALATPPTVVTPKPLATPRVAAKTQEVPPAAAGTQPLQITPVFENKSETGIRVRPETPRVASVPRAKASLRRQKPMPTNSFSEVKIPAQKKPQPQATVRRQPEKLPVIRKSADDSSNVVRTPERKPAQRQSRDDMLLSNRSPVLVVQTHGQTKIRVGRSATYYVTASNKGDLAAEDVVVDVNVPNWAELTRNQSTAGAVRVEPNLNGDNVLHWSIRDLKPGSNQRLRIDLVPRASRPIELGVTWNLKSVSAMAQIEVEEPKLQLSVVGPADIRFGDTKLYSITVSNPGSGEAENVVLQLLPVNGSGGTAGERELGDIKAGTQRTIEVELTARQAGDLAIRAQASADGGLRAEGEQPVRVRRPNLVVKASGPRKRFAGTPARYTIKVTNSGDATARDVLATAGLPMGAQFIKSSKNGAFDKNRNLVQWSIGSLRPGAHQIVEVTTVLNGAGESRLDARAAAKPDQLSAADSAVTAVEALADLRLTVVDPVGPVPLETEVAYEVRIENRGTKSASNINIMGYFSEGIEPVSVQGWQGDVQVGEVALDTIPQVSPGQRLVIKVMAKASRAGNHVFRAELDSDDPSTKTKLAVEEWTVFHEDNDGLPGLEIDDIPVQQADNSEDTEDLILEPVLR